MVEKRSLFVLFAFLALASADSSMRFIFYHEPTFVTEFTTSDFFTILNHPGFRRNSPTVLFHYGEDQTITTPQVHDLVSAYAANGQFNYILVHYTDPRIIQNGDAVDLAEAIGITLTNFFNNGYNSGLMNLIGFGLGAQIIARASRRVQEMSSRRHVIGRLTGLDPIQLGFISGNRIGRLSSADAQWVESIHTEGNQLGDNDSNGHISFFANGGPPVTQPMCTQTLPGNRAECSHIFALTFWAESVRATVPTFGALSCPAWDDFVNHRCNNNVVAHMGRSNAAMNLRGPFFLRTNMQPPWSRTVATP